MQRLFNNHHNPLAFYSAGFQTLKIIVIIESIVILILTTTLFVVNKKQQIIVGIDSNGIPYPMQIEDKNLENLINVEQFITSFLQKMYCWDSNSYLDQIKSSLPMMNVSLRNKYINEIQDKGYIESITKNNITHAIKGIRINTDQAGKYKDGIVIPIEVIKVRITDFIERTTPVNIELMIRPVRVSKNNIWGLEVFGIKEYEITR